MKYYLLTIGLTISTVAFGQKAKPLAIDTERQYKIASEDSLYDIGGDGIKSDLWKISADLGVPTNDLPTIKLNRIRFTKGKIKGDTITILIYETNPAYHHEYEIDIVNGRYIIAYNFLTSGEPADRKIKTKDFKLILNTSDFSKGKQIRGYTEFTGKCSKGCWPGFPPIDIKGYFKVTLD